MSYLGDFALSATFDKKFTTINTTGVPTALQGTPVISAYRDNSVTQVTAGITLTTNFDSVAGYNNVRIVMTNSTNFPAGNYNAVITTGTVAGKSVVGYVVCDWSINNRSLQGRIPTTLVSGRMDSSVGAMASATLTATAINTAAFTAAKFGTGAVTSTVLNTGAITAAKFGTGAVTSTVLGAAAITSAKIAANALNATGLSTTAAAKVHTSVNAGTVGTNVTAILADTGTDGVAVATGAITTTSFGAGAINAAAIAADAIGASELAQGAAQEVADEVLNRDLAGGASGGTRNVRNALRTLRNKTSISGTTLTVTTEDDTTEAWTATVTTAAGNPLTSIDPAGP